MSRRWRPALVVIAPKEGNDPAGQTGGIGVETGHHCLLQPLELRNGQQGPLGRIRVPPVFENFEVKVASGG